VSEDNKWIYKKQYTGGLQEYIEAISLRYFLSEPSALLTLEDIRARLLKTTVHCSEEDYLLGLTDLTGELMRLGINAIGSTGLEESEAAIRRAESLVRQIRAGMSPLSPRVRQLSKKLSVMDQTLLKLERTSYAVALKRNEYKDYPEALKEFVRRLNSEKTVPDHGNMEWEEHED